MDHPQNVWLISVPTERFVADASLSLQKTFVADASLSHRAKLPGGVQSPLQSTIYIVDVLTKVIHNFW